MVYMGKKMTIEQDNVRYFRHFFQPFHTPHDEAVGLKI